MSSSLQALIFSFAPFPSTDVTEEVKAGSDGLNSAIIGGAKREAKTLEERKSPAYSGCCNTYKNGELISVSENGKINNIYTNSSVK